jgi:hypothetical protein
MIQSKYLKNTVEVEIPEYFNVDNFYPFLEKFGYCFVQNAFNVDQLNLEDLIQAPIDLSDKPHYHDTPAIYYASLDNKINNFLSDSPIIKKFKTIFNTIFCEDTIFIRRRKNCDGGWIHRDGDVLFLKDNREMDFGLKRGENNKLFTVWVALCDIEIENGAICIIHEFNKNKELKNLKNNAILPGTSELQNALACETNNFTKNIIFTTGKMKKGDACIFSGNTLHTALDGLQGYRISMDFRITNIDFKDVVGFSPEKPQELENSKTIKFLEKDSRGCWFDLSNDCVVL